MSGTAASSSQPCDGAVDVFVLACDPAVLVDDTCVLRRPIAVESRQTAGTLRPRPSGRRHFFVRLLCRAYGIGTPKTERPGLGGIPAGSLEVIWEGKSLVG